MIYMSLNALKNLSTLEIFFNQLELISDESVTFKRRIKLVS